VAGAPGSGQWGTLAATESRWIRALRASHPNHTPATSTRSISPRTLIRRRRGHDSGGGRSGIVSLAPGDMPKCRADFIDDLFASGAQVVAHGFTSARTTPACPPRSVFPIHSRHSSSLCNGELTQSSVAGWVRGVAAGQQTDRFDRRRKRLRLTAGQSDRTARFDRSRRGSASCHVGRGDPTTRLRFG
jgi:hypothetical protein